MRLCVILSFVLLAGCVNESRHFRGVGPLAVVVDGSSFDVRVRGNLAEAVRLNTQYAPRLGPMRARAGFAMAQVSGCRVTGLLGDQAVMTGVLDCSTVTQLPVVPEYSCVDVVLWLQDRAHAGGAEYTCSPVH